jgi:hypothetical protein
MPAKIEITPIKDNAISHAIKNRSIYALPDGEKTMYLSDWFDLHPEVFRDGKFYNQDQSEAKFVLIFAGVGAGKTHFATQVLGQYGNIFFNCSRSVIREQQKKYLSENRSQKYGSDDISNNEKKGDTIAPANDFIVEENEQGYYMYIGTSWSLKNPAIFEKAATTQYLVIDEAHHMFSDSFCDAPNYVHELLQEHNSNKTIILMTACTNFMKEAFEYASIIENMEPSQCLNDEFKYGELFKLPVSMVLAIDLRLCCRNLHPKTVKIISPKYAARLINKINNDESKVMYYCKSAKRAYSIASRLIMKGKKAVAVTSSMEKKKPVIKNVSYRHLMHTAHKFYGDDKYKSFNKKQLKKELDLGYLWYNKLLKLRDMTELEKQTLKLIEDGRFPSDVDILVSTTKLREGANLNIDTIDMPKNRFVFTEVYDEVNLTQVIGRIRTEISYNCNIDCLYIVMNRWDYNYRLKQTSSNPLYSPLISDDQLNGMELLYWEELSNKLEDEKNQDMVTAIQEITEKINANTTYSGQVYVKPKREDYKINKLLFARNPLWYINFWINEQNRMRSLFSFENTQSNDEERNLEVFITKVSDIIPNAAIEVIRKNYDEDEVISIIREYSGDYIRREKIQELYSRLVEAGFILQGDHMWHAIRKLNCFTCVASSSRRQKYIISEVNMK